MDCKAHEEPVPMCIKPEDLHLYKFAKFLDVRHPDAYAQGHVNNAVNAYELFTYLLASSSKDGIDKMNVDFKEQFGQWGITGKEHIIIYEQSMDNQYGASSRGFFILKYMKHPNVSTLEGGLDALIATEGGAQYITQEPSTIIKCEYNGCDTDTAGYQMADRDEVLQIVNNKVPGKHLLDVRDAIEWNGLSSSPYGVDYTPRKGRIPNAIWIEWYSFHELDNEKNVTKRKSPEQIQDLMTANGIDKNDEIIIYCFKGSRVSVALMSLKQAGYNNVKNYFASWNEWSRDLQLPINNEIYR